jgi:MarR family transcriptional regulator for hemolysin
MSDSPVLRGLPFESALFGPGDARPSLGQIGLQQFAPYLINSVSLSWTTQLAAVVKRHDLTTTKLRALAILSIASPVTINELSLYALTEQSTMSRTLDALEEQGFILRRARAEDLRVRDVHITEAGRAVFAQAWPDMYDLLLKVFEGVDGEEYAAFTATLHKLIANIRKHCA